MTVSYSNHIATAKSLTLIKLIFCRWHGSVLKLLWKDLLLYIAIFYSIHTSYMLLLNEAQKDWFEVVVKEFKKFENVLPISFVLGFFVSNVMTRWWDQYQSIPWPYSIAVYVSSIVKGYDEVGRCIRRTIMRYVCLSLTMVFRRLSTRVKDRFPLMRDLIDAGLLTKNELAIIEDLDNKYPGYGKNWLPIVWAAALVNRARSEGRIDDDFAVKTIIEALNSFRGKCGNLMNYNEIYIPLVYTQVVGIAVYFIFIVKLISHQYIKNDDKILIFDFFPILIILEFVFYMGWLKVAETMMNPFGEDDDDFEVNSMIDHNLQVSYLIVDEMHNEHPELLKDQYWDQIPEHLPDRVYEDSEHRRRTEKLRETDIFNVIKKESSAKRVTRATVRDVEIGEAAENSGEPKLHRVDDIDEDLIPRSTVISPNYLNLPGVEIKQSLLDRSMQRKREMENESLTDSGTSRFSKRTINNVSSTMKITNSIK